ncbi:MAG: restriction endonuclease subunit S [Desulfuromonadales bacterium]
MDEGVPVIRGNNLTFGHRKFVDDGFVYLTENKAQEFRNCVAVTDDLIFTAAGTIGQVGIIPAETRFDRYIISNKQLRVRCDRRKVSPLFLFLWFTTEKMRQHIINKNTGCSIPLINLGILRGLPIPLPALDVQERIASAISTYDDLIENNRRRIALLEEAARQVYQEWFVRLRFPGREHTRIVDGVPEGWEKCCVKNLGRVITGKTPSTTDSSNHGGDIPFVKTPDMHGNAYVTETESFLTDKGAESQSGKFVPANTILVSCIGAKLGAVSLTSCRAQFNQQINAVIPSNEVHTFFCYFACTDMKPTLEALGGGATMPNVNKSKFENLTVILPSRFLCKNFHEFCSPVFRQIQVLALQNQKLRTARDLLLPKLMSGEIAV